MSPSTMARTLGWISLGIAATELAAPRKLEELMGLGDGEITGILRTLGIRELLHGVDILSHQNPTPGIWGRVAGDLLDGVLLAVAAAKSRRPAGLAATAAAVLPVVAADLVCAARLSTKSSLSSLTGR